ncbi:MAG: DNA-binding domain-containing protein [Alphaproteobacteria bacterium]|nr:DNA-binding domain-containing protein [Alphaproteobacteria bacterium]MBU1526136.1 DNA-binding domain-containing protein [Alphaproteobacteria bacterium]MBU2116601.1 DNA-binding domain-containing protein [Alphaproteobacteria bacterium]MBU2350227.1 DNA-binding domain-containing protein [Alphaproteobacteria bacterium]MBU2381403.1 DNA-binding domain-containing protein [Alphaproteobacteria bacterium]
MTTFHADFADDLRRTPASGPMAVYANGVVLGAVRALADNYPTIVAMLGDEAFEAAAVDHVRVHPPSDPVLAIYGADFPDWLARFPPLADWPWLGPVARLDRAWTEAHLAPDAPVLTVADLSRAGATAMVRPLRLHPSLRVFLFDWTAPSLWRAHRDGAPGDLVWDRQTEGLAIWRPHDVVRHRPLTPDAHALLVDCGRGRPLAVAMSAAAARGVDASALVSGLVEAGLFTPDPTETP